MSVQDELNNYVKLDNGIIKQKNVKQICNYDNEYVSKYNSYGEKGNYLAQLRFGFLIGSLGFIPNNILDVGYGNGDFLRACSNLIENCYGTDISGYPLPEKVKFLDWNNVLKNEFDVITFFDSLEHFEDIYTIKELKAKYIFISLPWCHYESDEWFLNWKHRRPDEHLWHFNRDALINFFKEIGYEMVNCGIAFEDAIRKDPNLKNNILTGIFKKI